MLLTCASIAFFIFFGRDFPPQMAVPFAADGHIDRVKFIVLGSFLSFMLPTFIVAVIGVLPRVLPSKMPDKTRDAMLWGSLWFGCLVQAGLMAMNIAIYRANLR